MWFDELTGFKEQGAAQVRQLLRFNNDTLYSLANNKSWQVGQLHTPSVSQLRIDAAHNQLPIKTPITVTERVADVQHLHADPANAGALFQVASQFNLLEMVSPIVTPDHGVSNYQFDRTQGPACAIACGAGLIYRNYFVPIDEQIGQTEALQLNMLDKVAPVLVQLLLAKGITCSDSTPWLVRNGYALPSMTQLNAVNELLAQLSDIELEQLSGLVKIGVQQDTQVTLLGCEHTVTQAYCSAMPVAYSQHSAALWQPLASFILNAAYEATLAAAVVNCARTGNNNVYLTLLGGGAFGNSIQWICDAILNALLKYQHSGLAITIVSYGRSKLEMRQLISDFNNIAKTHACEPHLN